MKKRQGIKISQPVLVYLACILLVGAVITLFLIILLCGAWLDYSIQELNEWMGQWFSINSGLGF